MSAGPLDGLRLMLADDHAVVRMGFRMLLGRQAIRGRFLVDPGRSYANGRRVKGTNRIKRRLDAKR